MDLVEMDTSISLMEASFKSTKNHRSAMSLENMILLRGHLSRNITQTLTIIRGGTIRETSKLATIKGKCSKSWSWGWVLHAINLHRRLPPKEAQRRQISQLLTCETICKRRQQWTQNENKENQENQCRNQRILKQFLLENRYWGLRWTPHTTTNHQFALTIINLFM